ncbi:MAG: FAD-dependent oxidoreductase [Chloroflexi bacterium]|nr:FAD-dependent oxidoreductase [Chloroflexota bacterium]
MRSSVKMQFPRLVSPIKIGNVEIKNRMVAAPMGAWLGTPDGHVTERLKETYRQRAKGGYGLVTVEATWVRRDGNQMNRMLGIENDSYIGGLNELVEVIHEFGGKASIQLMHSGAVGRKETLGARAMGPSGITLRPNDEVHVLKEEEIEDLISAFAAAARRARLAGFDLVMLHFAHGLLLQQFHTPFFNRRKDRWGEPTAFGVEVIRRCKEVLGNVPLYIRVSGDDMLKVEGSADVDHIKKILPAYVEAGAQAIDVSMGQVFTMDSWTFPPIYRPRGCFMDITEAIKQSVSVPVIGVGRINDPRLAENILERGRADMVAFGRQSYADPEFPRKVIENRPEDIRRCIACDVGCTLRAGLGQTALCAINYEYGRMPWEYEIVKADEPRKIIVVGGGVAGMEFARVAALRGHAVTLYERAADLGGQVTWMSSRIPRLNTRDLRNIVIWLREQLERLPVRILLGAEVARETVASENPDVVVLATGSHPRLPDIPGVERPGVMTLDTYLINRPPMGNRIAVLGGGHGIETAISLAIDGKAVTVVEKSSRTISTVEYLRARRNYVANSLKEKGVTVLTETVVRSIVDGGVQVVSRSGEERLIPADNVIIALDREPNRELLKFLKGEVPVVHTIGDCIEPKTIQHAIHSASALARTI